MLAKKFESQATLTSFGFPITVDGFFNARQGGSAQKRRILKRMKHNFTDKFFTKNISDSTADNSNHLKFDRMTFFSSKYLDKSDLHRRILIPVEPYLSHYTCGHTLTIVRNEINLNTIERCPSLQEIYNEYIGCPSQSVPSVPCLLQTWKLRNGFLTIRKLRRHWNWDREGLFPSYPQIYLFWPNNKAEAPSSRSGHTLKNPSCTVGL